VASVSKNAEVGDLKVCSQHSALKGVERRAKALGLD